MQIPPPEKVEGIAKILDLSDSTPRALLQPSPPLLRHVEALAGIAPAVLHLLLVVTGAAVAVSPVVPAVEDERPRALEHVAKFGVVRGLEVPVIVHFVDPVGLGRSHELLHALMFRSTRPTSLALLIAFMIRHLS